MSLELENFSSNRKSFGNISCSAGLERRKSANIAPQFSKFQVKYKKMMNHKILVKSCNEAETPSNSKISPIDSFFKKEKESVSEVIAQLVAKDGFSFHQIARSPLTRRAFKSDGFDIPVIVRVF